MYAFLPQSFWLRRKGRKGAACLGARIGLDQLNVDLSQSANNQSPVPNLSIDLVSSYNFNVAFHAVIDIAFNSHTSSRFFLPLSFPQSSYTYLNCNVQTY